MPERFVVTSNVARDILQTADDFGSVPKMIVEYVTNGLDNPGDVPVGVTVRIRSAGSGLKEVSVTDNGCGMDEDGLAGFFTMHRENLQRQRGHRARGRFGTGKSAGFGVGTALTLDTVHDGRRWRVTLTRDELVEAAKADRAPTPVVEVDGDPTTKPTGTIVTVSGIAKQANVQAIENELRRRLGRELESHPVSVDGHRVRIVEPEAAHTWTFTCGTDPASDVLGSEVICRVHAVAAGATVSEELRGVMVTSQQFPVAQYVAAGDMSKRLWGVCEVPALDADTSPPGPFTDRRDLTLNLDNPLAAAVDGWVRRCLEQVAHELQQDELELRRRRRDADLDTAATRAEAALNEHFRTVYRGLAHGAGISGTESGDSKQPATGVPADDGRAVTPNPDGTAGYEPPPRSGTSEPGSESGPGSGEHGGEQGRLHDRDPLAPGRGDPISVQPGRRRRRTGGGFHIDYANTGPGSPRAAYFEESLTIVINLDHPLLALLDTGSDLFQGLAFTVAAEEYAQATATELVAKNQLEDPFDALQYERSTMEAVTRAFADVLRPLTDAAAA